MPSLLDVEAGWRSVDFAAGEKRLVGLRQAPYTRELLPTWLGDSTEKT